MIGATLYRFDANRRVYAPPPPRPSLVGNGPIWREHWRPVKVVAQTSRSWVMEDGTKCPKRGADPATWSFSEREVDEKAFVEKHSRGIAERIRPQYGRARIDYATLCRVAEVVGYSPARLEDDGGVKR